MAGRALRAGARERVRPLAERPYLVVMHRQVVDEDSPLLGEVLVSEVRVDGKEADRLQALEGHLLPPTAYGSTMFMLEVEVRLER